MCGGCAAAKRDCSFRNSSGATLPLLPSPSPSSTAPASPLSHRLPSNSPGPTSSPHPHPYPHPIAPNLITAGQLHPVGSSRTEQQHCPNGASEENCYSLLHLQLLHHLDHGLLDSFGPGQSEVANKVLQMAKMEAFAAPFLMDELLALSAAHRSAVVDDENQRESYRAEATRLQTRALAQYNTAVTQHQQESSSTSHHLLAIFLFSTFLGQHILFDTFSLINTTNVNAGHHHIHLAAFLDQLMHCLHLNKGIAAIAGRSWPTLKAELRARLGPDATRFDPEPAGAASDDTSGGVTPAGRECAILGGRLAGGNDSGSSMGGSELSPSSRDACRVAVDALRRMFDAQEPPAGSGTSIQTENQPPQISDAQKWLVSVPYDYINLLARRQPEALVILAYYAVMLHQARGHWVVGNAGEALIRGIGDYLGAYWAGWLEWPMSTL